MLGLQERSCSAWGFLLALASPATLQREAISIRYARPLAKKPKREEDEEAEIGISVTASDESVSENR